MILNCKCENEFQDKVYGPGRRVHNAGAGSGSGVKQYSCTACGETQTKGGEGDTRKAAKRAAKKAA